MIQQYTIKCLILLLIIIQHVHCIDIFIKNSRNGTGEIVQELKHFTKKTYEIPLFQTRFIKIIMNGHDNKDIIKIQFQINSTDIRVVHIQKATNENLAVLPNKTAFGRIFTVQNPTDIDITWLIKANRMDETKLTFIFNIFYHNGSISSYQRSLNILVTQPKRIIDKIFLILLPFLVIFISIQMGILLDTSVLIDLVKKPKPVIIGFLSQYGLMPFIAMGIAKLFNYTPLYSLALFVVGCCPGSGMSNQWTLLFDGDVNLSAVMSFVSTSASFVMMPLYFYTLGRIYMDELSIRVPFLGLVRSLALVVIPYAIGICISHYSSKIRLLVERLVKPMMLFFLIFFLIFGTIVNWYLIKLVDLHTTLTAPLLPYLGFLIGALFAWICGLSWTHIKTVGIEAGIQNHGIAFMIIFYSFPQPYAAKAIVVPLVVAFLTTKPFWLVYVIRSQLIKYKKKNELNTNKDLISIENNNGKLILVDEKPSEENHTKEDIVITQTL